MSKKILAVLLALIMCFGMFGCETNTPEQNVTERTEKAKASPTPQVEENTSAGSTPLLYQVTDKDGNVIWLFGSIHVGKEDFYPLPDYVMEALDASDALAVEADIVAFEKDLVGQTKALQKLIYMDGTSIKDHVSADSYDSAVAILKDNKFYNAMLDYYMPSLWVSFIENCTYTQAGADMELGIDRYLLSLAKESKKEILEVESVAFQYEMLGGFSQELQAVLLEDAITTYQNPEEVKGEMERLMTLWASGNEQDLSAYFSTDVEIEDPQEVLLYEEYYTAMIASRNDSMTAYAEDALQSGKKVFICVGAAHVVGEGAMAQQLRALGYTVEIVK